MKKFKFQLETLLKVTKMNRDQAQVKMAAAAKKLEEARQRLEVLLEEMAQGHKDYDAITSKGSIPLGPLMTYNSFFNWKREQIEQQQRHIIECQAEKQRCMQELVKIMNKLKSIEQLKEKRFQQYMAELFFEEQKLLDEIGGQLYFRSMG